MLGTFNWACVCISSALALFLAQPPASHEPESPQGQFNLGFELAKSGRPKDAIDHLQRASADPALASESLYLLGACYFQLGRYPNAIASLDGLTNGSRADHVLYMLEESHRLLNHQPEAREAFRQLNRRFPDSAWTHYLLANAYEQQAQYDQAIAEYTAALARDPHLPNAPFAIGYMFWRQQDLDNAKTWFEKELAAQPCHALASFYLGQIARAGQDWTDAAKNFRRSLACDDTSSETHLRLGMTLTELNQDQEALRELRRAAQLAPENPTAHYRLAVLYKKLGRTAESQAEYDTLKRIQSKEAKP